MKRPQTFPCPNPYIGNRHLGRPLYEKGFDGTISEISRTREVDKHRKFELLLLRATVIDEPVRTPRLKFLTLIEHFALLFPNVLGFSKTEARPEISTHAPS